MLDLAHTLTTKLPGTYAAFRSGTLRESKVAIIARAVTNLTPAEARAAEAKVLDRAGKLTPGGLRAAIRHAVIEVNPEKAREQREKAAQQARVERWAEDSGNAGLAGRELPPADVLAADQRISWWARQLKKAGLDGDMDQLRAIAYTDIMLNRDSRPAAGRGNRHHGGPGDPSGSREQPGRSGPDGPGPSGPGGGPDDGGGPDPQDPPSPHLPPTAGVLPVGFTGHINLTVPLSTQLGLADRPGEIAGLGPVDPDLARQLTRAAAANPKTTWCVTVTDEHGHAIGHGCARPEPKNHTRTTKDPRPQPPTRLTRLARRHLAAAVHLHRLRPARAARRVRRVAADHRRPRPPRPADHPGPDRAGGMRPPVPGPRSRPRRQAPAPGPDPARDLYRPDLPAARGQLRLRAQYPVRKRRPDMHV
jgi:hypothetical protein